MNLPGQLEPPVALNGDARRRRRVLLIAWEYPGANSRRGAALSRRVGQLARGLARQGWHVTVIHRLQRDDDPARLALVEEPVSEGQVIRRRAVPGPSTDSRIPAWLAPLRKVATLWTAFRRGDRSGRWAPIALRVIEAGEIEPPDIVIAFFTPRGPLAAASALHRTRRTPWLADFQDPWWEGASGWLRRVVARWMRSTLRSAAAVVQVSPEWAAGDAAVLRREVRVVRHAVPRREGLPTREASRRHDGIFRIIYVGSINPDQQDIGPFMDALVSIRSETAARPVELQVAGGPEAWSLFEKAAAARAMPDGVRWLGWLDEPGLRRAMDAADCLLLVPMMPTHRQGVPSKLFEYLAYDTPVLIAGPDSGGMASLLEEWAHPPVVAHTSEQIASVVRRARDGDLSGLLQRSRCRAAPVTDETLAEWYSEQMHSVLGGRLTCAG